MELFRAVPYARAACLLRACAVLLRMPPRAVATAVAFLHQRQAAEGGVEPDVSHAAWGPGFGSAAGQRVADRLLP
jgi:hypothetical protein